MKDFNDHLVVVSLDLWQWLQNEAGEEKRAEIWRGGDPNLVNLRKQDIVNSLWVTYSPDENTTGIYISGYSVGDGKSRYDDNQNVIAADIAYREAGEITPPEPERVFKVYVMDDPYEGYIGSIDENTLGEYVTFMIRTDVPIETESISIQSNTSPYTTPGQITYHSTDSENGYYYYTFTVELTTVNPNSSSAYEDYDVIQGTSTGGILVTVPGTEVTPPTPPTPENIILKVFLTGDPDESNKGYVNNELGSTANFTIRTNVRIEDQPIYINTISSAYTTPDEIIYSHTSDGYYYYTFDVEVTTLNQNSSVVADEYVVQQGGENGNAVVYIAGTSEGVAGELYTEMPYVYKVGTSGGNSTSYTEVPYNNYSFKAEIGDTAGVKTVIFPTSSTSPRISNKCRVIGVAALETDLIIDNGYKLNVPVAINLNAGVRTFTPNAESSITVYPDSTTLFRCDVNPSGSTEYERPYTQYFETTGDIVLDTSYGGVGEKDGVQLSDSLYAKFADVNGSGTISVLGCDVVSGSSSYWHTYNGYTDSPQTFDVEKLSNVTLSNAKYFKVVAHKLDGNTLTILIAGNHNGNDVITGYGAHYYPFSDSIYGTVDGERKRFDCVKTTYSPYVYTQMYIEIPNYSSSSQYVFDLNSDSQSSNEGFLGAIAYSFGAGVKCVNPDEITNRLWKFIGPYSNTDEITLCHILIRDGNVPMCDKDYIQFRVYDDSSDLIEYEVYCDNINYGIREDLGDSTLQIHIYSKYDPHAKSHDFEPDATIISGFYSVSDKNGILAYIAIDGKTPRVKFCTTNGYYAVANGGIVAQSAVTVEDQNTASQYFDGTDRMFFNIGTLSGQANAGVFDGFMELEEGSNVSVIGTAQAFGWGD